MSVSRLKTQYMDFALRTRTLDYCKRDDNAKEDVSLILYTNVYLPVMVEFFCTKHA